MQVTSTAFKQGERIPAKFTGEGADVSPALAWTGAPAGTKSFALICDDPDAPVKEPWVHWVIWGIPPEASGLPEGVSETAKPKEVPGACQGVNGFPKTGYNGPLPPKGSGTHRYFFKVYALDFVPSLPEKATKKDLLKAMGKQVLGTGELMGTYSR